MIEPGRCSRKWSLLGLLFGVTLVVTGWALLLPHRPAMAWGELSGGAVGALIAIVLIFYGHKGSGGGGAARIAAGKGDERDTRVFRLSAAISGAVMNVLTVVAALRRRAPPIRAEAALGLLVCGYLLALVISQFVLSRRL